MRIKKIRFNNYRCFLDGEVVFPKNKSNKTINLFIAPNGGGKTEFLFSFWWAFYPHSFNFGELKGKEATNYSLNSDLYLQLKNGPIGGKKVCYVEVEFESENKTFVLNRTETFEKKSSKKISKSLSCSLYTIDEYGIATPPITEEKEVNNTLERLIPQKVLSGIIFDGERMKKISSIDNESAKSIEGVISDITNKEILLSFESELLYLKNQYQKLISKFAKRLQSTDIEEVANQLNDKETKLAKMKLEFAKINNKIPALEQELIDISEKLQALEESRIVEENLKIATNDMKHYRENYEKDLEVFRKQISKDGSHILVKKLIKDLETIINNTNVPLGLNVKIVENILEKDTCICGNPFSHDMRVHMQELKKKLPPNDINATIKEKTKTIQMNATNAKERLKDIYKSMDNNYKKIIETNEEIVRLKTLLSESVSAQVVKLQTERGRVEERLDVEIRKKDSLTNQIEKMDKEIDKLKELQKNLTRTEEELNSLQAKKDFIEKSIKAINEIQEKYRMLALTEINQLFKDAYKDISEDYSNGRRAYLTHRLSKKYFMVTYNEYDLINFLNDTKGYDVEKIKSNNIDLDVLEDAINTIKISNSTGQQTVLSLAFVKAILDYSRRESNVKDRELKKVKSYPVVIDAPFSDLSGDNLNNAASNLNNFSEQVILLINPTSFDSIRDNIMDNVNSIHYFHKNKGGQHSTIEEGNVTVE